MYIQREGSFLYYVNKVQKEPDGIRVTVCEYDGDLNDDKGLTASGFSKFVDENGDEINAAYCAEERAANALIAKLVETKRFSFEVQDYEDLDEEETEEDE